MISIFHGNDEITHEKFQRWRRANVDGFHMTEGPAGKFTIHYTQDKRESSTGRGCMHQGVSDIAYLEDNDHCFTRTKKVCSNSFAELLAWAKKQGFTTKNCKHCDTKRSPFPKDVSLPGIKRLQAEQAKEPSFFKPAMLKRRQQSASTRAEFAYLFLWNPKKDPKSFENFDRILRSAASARSYTTRWICPSIRPKAGDLAIVQRTGNANNGLFAMGHITRAPFEVNGNRVVGLKLDSFLPVGSEITKKEIVEAANYKKTWSPMASGNIIPDELLLAIRSLWAVRTGHSNAEQVPASRATAGGAGFGNPENNKEVETAAIAFVTNMYESNDWHVKSVENEKCGFDLICTHGETIENVEVKGIRGDDLNFIITTGELEEAKKNNKFVLYAVTQVLSAPHSSKFSGPELSEMFNMVPLQYRAVYKK